ncbi:MAG: DNA glycosylase [Methanosarcinaceae archaeon]|nr:DNA glycosylase [Methanosarcinaceae archaeon]MDD4749000.1 DNA glycosylase [Methanosarcinaceae archaeon]
MYRLKTSLFNLNHSLDCGQVFRWSREGELWTGVVLGEVVRISQEKENGTLLIDSNFPPEFFKHYFRLDDDLPLIYKSINKDPLIERAIEKYAGLRLIRQEPWECLISYMLATASSIPTIQKRIVRLSEYFGEELEEGYYAFPGPKALARADSALLDQCKMGFRRDRVQTAAKLVNSGELDLASLFEIDYASAKNRLMKLRGIGEKVADCILLFAFGKMEAFPVDTHIRQLVQHYHIDNNFIQKSPSLSRMGAWGRKYFGPYCGYAQQYLFYQKRIEGLLSLD